MDKSIVYEKALLLINTELDIISSKPVLDKSDREFLVRVLDKTQDTTINTNSSIEITMSDEELLKMLGQEGNKDAKPVKKTTNKRIMETWQSDVFLQEGTTSI